MNEANKKAIEDLEKFIGFKVEIGKDYGGSKIDKAENGKYICYDLMMRPVYEGDIVKCLGYFAENMQHYYDLLNYG